MFLASQNKRTYINSDELVGLTIQKYIREDKTKFRIKATMKNRDEFWMGEYETMEDAEDGLQKIMLGSVEDLTKQLYKIAEVLEDDGR